MKCILTLILMFVFGVADAQIRFEADTLKVPMVIPKEGVILIRTTDSSDIYVRVDPYYWYPREKHVKEIDSLSNIIFSLRRELLELKKSKSATIKY